MKEICGVFPISLECVTRSHLILKVMTEEFIGFVTFDEVLIPLLVYFFTTNIYNPRPKTELNHLAVHFETYFRLVWYGRTTGLRVLSSFLLFWITRTK